MSSFKNFSSMLNDLQRQADGRGTLDGSAIEDFLSIAGYEDPSGGGGGGGSSDFSTAQVTVIGEYAPFSIPNIIVDPEYGLEGSIPTTDEHSSPYTIILYKGKAYLLLQDVAVSGDISQDPVTSLYVVTGDCTIEFNAPV